MPNIIKNQDIKTLLCWMFGVILALGIYGYQRDMGYLKETLTTVKEDLQEGVEGNKKASAYNTLKIVEISTLIGAPK